MNILEGTLENKDYLLGKQVSCILLVLVVFRRALSETFPFCTAQIVASISSVLFNN